MDNKCISLEGFIIEISWPACYGPGWSYMTSRVDLDTALDYVSKLKFPEQYRIVKNGKVIF